MNLVLLLLKQSRALLVLAILAAILGGGSSTGLLALLNGALSQLSDEPLGLGVAWSFFGLCIVVPVARIFSELLLIRLGQRSIFQLRMDLSERVLAISLRRLEEVGSHRILSTFTEDIPTITNSVTAIPLLCFNLAIVITGLIYLLTLSLAAFLSLSVLLFIGILMYQIPIIKANRFFHRSRRTNDRLYDHFQALTQGLKELKLHRRRRQAFLETSLKRTAAEFENQNVAGASIYAISASWAQFMVFFILGLLIFVLPTHVTSITPQVLVGYTLVFLYLVTPLQVIMNSLPNLNRASVAIRRIDELGLGLRPEELAPVDARDGAGAQDWTSLELVGATHTFHREGGDRDFVLGPIDLMLQPGELIFLIGGNGSGKTTLAKLLLGLYLPEEGEVKLDGETVTRETIESYRQLFAVVFSDFFLFEELLGLDAPDLDERARRYLVDLQLDHKVEIEDGVVSTTKLSQGQRKRLALLTALLENRPIYLFDEWAADQDPSFKKSFYHVFLPELRAQGKTAIVISHDDFYYHVADRIIKLDYGQIQPDERTVRSGGPTS